MQVVQKLFIPGVSKVIMSLALLDVFILRCKGRLDEGKRIQFMKNCTLLGIPDDSQNPKTNNAMS
jgi:hypothetical protein